MRIGEYCKMLVRAVVRADFRKIALTEETPGRQDVVTVEERDEGRG